ncbi:hypothetical protein FS842_009100 [Serendipita sp. 407]|nr:hypothetical protein FS842_009100 [Serendipita sp. 407]
MISFRSTLIASLRVATRYLCVILLSIPTSLVLVAASILFLYAGHASYALRWLIAWTLTLLIPSWAGLEYLLEHPIRQDGAFFRFSGLWLLRQIPLGRRMIAELSKRGLVKPLYPPIPVEIWSHIIEYAIAVPEYLGTDCDAKDVPEFLYYHQMQSNHLYDDLSRLDGIWSPTHTLTRPEDPYNHSEWFRNQLRLVCSRWKDIVDRHATRWVFQSQMPDVRNRWGRGIQRVDILIQGQYMSGEAGATYHGTYLSPLQDCLGTTNILAAREETWSVSPTGGDEAVDHLVLNPTKILESIQSFAYHCHGSQLSTQSFSLLSTSLANLRILILETREITGNMTFPYLHTLQLISDNINLHGWQCPNLHHLALTTHDVPEGHRYDMSIIPGQFNSLTALLVRSLAVELNNAFWSRFPHLELLGFYRLILTDPPPEGHPLSHLYTPRWNIYGTSPDELAATLDVLHPSHERTLQIGKIPSASELTDNQFTAEWEAFYNKCKREGIRWRKLPADVGVIDKWPKMRRDFWNEERLGKWIKEWYIELLFAGVHGLITLVLAADMLYFVERSPQWSRFMHGEIIASSIVFVVFCVHAVLSFNSHLVAFPFQSISS